MSEYRTVYLDALGEAVETMTTSWRRLSSLILVACLIPTAFANAREALSPPVKLKIGYISAMYDAPILIAYEKGYFAAEGLDIDLMKMKNATDSLQALGVEALHATTSSSITPLFNARERGIPLTIVAGAGVHSKGRGVLSLVIRKDLVENGRYKSLADLKGMKIVAPLHNPGQWMVVEAARRVGIAENQIDFVSLGYSNTIPAMSNKAVDGLVGNEPVGTRATADISAVPVLRMDEVAPMFPVGYVMVGSYLARANPEAARRFLIGYIKGVRDARDAFGPERKDYAKIDTILTAYDLLLPPGTILIDLPADGAASFDNLDLFLDWQVREGSMSKKPDPRSALDDRFRMDALKALDQ